MPQVRRRLVYFHLPFSPNHKLQASFNPHCQFLFSSVLLNHDNDDNITDNVNDNNHDKQRILFKVNGTFVSVCEE